MMTKKQLAAHSLIARFSRYAKVYGASNIYIDGDYVIVKSNGVPDHKSPYCNGTEWEATMYEADNDAGSKQTQIK
jgi:hypothetical protein